MDKLSNRVFIIAEISANHNNDLDLALDTVRAIYETGADAVKVQTYTADSLVLNVDNEYFGPRKSGLWKGRKLYDLFQEGSLPYEWHIRLKEEAEKLGLVFFSSPFSTTDVDFLESIDVPMYKIASLEITHIPLIKYVAGKGKPIIMSTGVAEEEDIRLAVETCRAEGNNDITLLKCTTAYPAPYDEVNLNAIPLIKEKFGTKIGLSDHTMGNVVPLGAVALGAKVIEKHFILDRNLGGIDSQFSMNPEEFKLMVDSVRILEKSLGMPTMSLTEKAKDSKTRSRSIFVSNDVEENEIVTSENIRVVRPGHGLHPKHYEEVLGKKFIKSVKGGQPLSWDDIN